MPASVSKFNLMLQSRPHDKSAATKLGLSDGSSLSNVSKERQLIKRCTDATRAQEQRPESPTVISQSAWEKIQCCFLSVVVYFFSFFLSFWAWGGWLWWRRWCFVCVCVCVCVCVISVWFFFFLSFFYNITVPRA